MARRVYRHTVADILDLGFLVDILIEFDLTEEWPDLREAAFKTKSGQTLHGQMNTRMLVTDASGNEVAFPLNVILEATLDDAD
jgi:hypothetical protein